MERMAVGTLHANDAAQEVCSVYEVARYDNL